MVDHRRRDASGLLWGLLFGLASAVGVWIATGHSLPRDDLITWGACALIGLGLVGGVLSRRQ